MSTRGVGRAPRRPWHALCAALAIPAALSLGACGSSDFPNDPRPPAPIEVTAKIDSGQVQVSPNHFGAGLVTFTIANLSNSPVRFTLNGTKKKVFSPEIQPGSPGSLKLQMNQGAYQASAGPGASAIPAAIKVGPERKTSQNK